MHMKTGRLLALAMAAVLAVGCLFTAEAGDKKIVIGCTLQNMSEEFMAMLKGAMEIQLKEYDNVTLIINDGEGKPA